MSETPVTLTSAFIPTPSLLPSNQTYDPFPKFIAPYIGAVFMETFLYGIYTILFSICFSVLIRRQKTLHWVLLAFALAMFALATADISYTFYIFFDKLLSGDLTFGGLYPKYVMFVTNTVLADTLLLYRCYVVWGCNKLVIIGPALLLIAAAVCGYLFEGASIHLFQHAWIYLSMTFSLNVILTCLTAGRIWYLAYKARSLIGQGLLKRYNASIAILIESGLIYSVYMVLDIAFHTHPTASAILDAGLIQIVGIVPTLIIVQVGLGRTVHDQEENEFLAQYHSRIESNKFEFEASPPSRHTSSSFPADPSRTSSMIFRDTIHSHRIQARASRYSNTSLPALSHELSEHRRSFRSGRSQHRSLGVESMGSRGTVFDLNLRLSADSNAIDDTRTDPYTAIPRSPRRPPPSPRSLSEMKTMRISRSVEEEEEEEGGKGYPLPFSSNHEEDPEAIGAVKTRESRSSLRTIASSHFSPV